MHRWVYYVDADVVLRRPGVPLSRLTTAHDHCLIVATDMHAFYASLGPVFSLNKPCPRGKVSTALVLGFCQECGAGLKNGEESDCGRGRRGGGGMEF